MEVPSLRCLRDELLWLQQSLSVLGSPVVLCHNDLLCKNIIYSQEAGEYWLHTCSHRHYCVAELCCSVNCIGPRTQVGLHYLHFLNASHMLHPLSVFALGCRRRIRTARRDSPVILLLCFAGDGILIPMKHTWHRLTLISRNWRMGQSAVASSKFDNQVLQQFISNWF